MKRLIPALLILSWAATAQTAAPPSDPTEIIFSGAPMVVPFPCNEDDLEWAGLSCDEAPCPIYVDLSHAAGQGKTILITGNFHATAATLDSLLLRTDDGGKTWREPFARIRGAELDHVQMYDGRTGWISGQTVQPLALDPFFLLTSDAGKTWERIPLFEEGTPGSILQFEFDTRDHGLALVDHGGGPKRYEVYETLSGGREWSTHLQSDTLPKIKAAAGTEWRIHAEPKLFRLQHLEEERWSPFVSFSVSVAKCRDEARPEPAEPKKETVKAIERELFRNLFVAVAEEMGVVLRRTAFSPNIKERRDYSCAIYDAQGETVAMGDHMPVHLGAMPLSVRAAIDRFALEPGDLAILNDPFQGGTHLPDITAVSGVFLTGDSKPAYYVASRAHHADVGGMSPGSMPLAREIYQEGLRLPPILLVKRGEIDRPLLDLILANVRTPEEREGDLLAQMNANRAGADRLLQMAAKHGRETLDRNMVALQDYSAAMMRLAIGKIPNGDYPFSDFLDDDGAGSGPIEIRVSVQIRTDSAIVDFAGSSPQVAGSVNANRAIAISATAYVFRCIAAKLATRDIPYNSGLLRPIEVLTPERSVVSAGPPAAMAAGNVETSPRITDTLFGALAQALPDCVPAASSGTMNNLTVGGWDARRNRPFAYYETIAGGSGASAEGSGASAIHTHMTNSWNTPAEAFEHEYPMRVRRYEVRHGSGGAGIFRGGDGVTREIEFLAAADVTILSDRRTRGPWGLAGGSAGLPGRNTLIHNGAEQTLISKLRFDVQAGDVLRIETPGGGGWGASAAPPYTESVTDESS